MSSPRATTVSSAVFSLMPLNLHTQNLVSDLASESFVRNYDGDDMIDVAFTPDRCGGLYPATIGKKSHVKIDRNFIANIQVSFELHKDTGEIMLVDRSPSQNCYVYYVQSDGECRDFYSFGALVLSPAANEIVITFGGSIKYRLYVEWRMRDPIDLEAWKSLETRAGQIQTLRSLPPTKRMEKGVERPPYERRFLLQRKIASNPCTRTTIHKCIDLRTGHCVAVKHVVDLIEGRSREEGETLKEITTDLSHESHIIEFFQVEILPDYYHLVMELQEGDLGGLVCTQEFREPRKLFTDGDTVGRPILLQMLKALDYLAFKDIIHRDIKPHNILYRRINGAYHYRLADFGIATIAPHERVRCGTKTFMAPEVDDRDSDLPHTTRIDVWGLAASVCWTFGLGLKGGKGSSIDVGHHVICPIWTGILGQMLKQDPCERPSAGEVLTLMFNGEGRVTDE